jgi:iron-sulfur cluster repair protein YtfE (RIC family)
MSDTLTIDPTLSVSEILRRHPGIHPVLASAGIDTCCGGGDSLTESARMSGVDLDVLLAAMHAELELSGDPCGPLCECRGDAR